MARKSQTSVSGLISPSYIFSALFCLGFFNQWITMIMHGSLVAMLLAAWKGVAPNGAAVKSTWTGIWPIDFTLSVLSVFFGGLLNLDELPNIGPYLLLADLIFTLAICGTMTLVEDRRNRKTGSLRYPAFWQVMWGYCGAASVLPIYSHLYVKHRLVNSPGLPRDQAQALPFTALSSVTLPLFLLLPTMLGATPFQVSDGVVVWFLAPIAVGLFQDSVSFLISRGGPFYRGVKNPIIVTYAIVGTASALVHLAVVAYIFSSPDLSWIKIYWPNRDAVQHGPTIIADAAMLFIQYGYPSVSLSVFALSIYALGFDKVLAAQSLADKLQASGPLFTISALMAIGGPGAGLAWLLCGRECDTDAANALRKKS
ncbi:hypothetical protein F5Y04DRAFT_253341 [Hypomontagnella monticulosa]|nr:hypothetical protein F5Y04DRAFT_253341 [Hypomontagnella monticulosa]